MNEIRNKTINETMAIACAWHDCRESYDCRQPQPKNWRMILIHHTDNQVFFSGKLNRERGIVDAALCPHHAAKIQGALKP